MRFDEHLRRSVPWRLPDLYLLVALVATGAILVGVARAGVAGRDELGEQVPWVNVGVGGLVVLCIGCVLWVLAGMRATAELRRAVLARVRATLEDRAPSPGERAGAGVEPGLVAGPAMTHFHRPACQLVAGKEVVPVGADPDGLRPCAICAAGADR
jgi:hypothetical protein